MHFNNDYLNYDGGNTDFLGFDDGTRSLPLPYSLTNYVGNTIQNLNPNDNLNGNLPNLSSDDIINQYISNSFNPNMSAVRAMSGMNFGFGLSTGNQFEVGEKKNKIGLFSALSYKNSTEFYENAQNNYFNRNNDLSVFELDTNRTQKGDLGINNVIISGLAGLSYKTKYSKYSLNVLHIQNGESKAGIFRQQTRFSDFIDLNKHNLEYTERSITNFQLAGSHTDEDLNGKQNGKYLLPFPKSTTDIRTTTFQDEGGVFSFQETRNLKDLEVFE